MPTDGGPERLVYSYTGYNQLIELPAWSHDDRSILFNFSVPKAEQGELLAVMESTKADIVLQPNQ